MKTKGKITISRPLYGDGQNSISIEVTDELSGMRFLGVKLSYEAFAEAITGLGYRPCEIETRGLENLGKVRVCQPRSIDVLDIGYGKEGYQTWLEQNAQEEGWILDTYLGSQNSIQHLPNGMKRLNYSVTQYVEPEQTA